MNASKALGSKLVSRIRRGVWQMPLAIGLTLLLIVVQPISSIASPVSDNHIILPADGQVVVNFITADAGCTGDFGLSSPQEISIYPDYLYYGGLPFPLPGYYTRGTELVFYLTPREFCSDYGTYLSTDSTHARITHPDPNRWIIAWEDWEDGDFNDLIVQVDFQPATIPFLDLPYDCTDSTFYDESKDTRQGGSVYAYFDHQYPSYSSAPNAPGYPNTVNFYGYDSRPTNSQPPYHVAYNGHDGIDYFIGDRTPVLAAASGSVTFVGQIAGYCPDTGGVETANVVKIRHDNGYTTEYWHLSSFAPGLAPGDRVTRDSAHPIGYSGNTECLSGPLLHFQVRNPSGIVVDPYAWRPLPDAAWYGQADPWGQYNADNGGADAASHYLWIPQLMKTTLLSRSMPTVVSSPSGSAIATFPVGAYGAALRLQMAEGLQSADVPGYRSLYTFSLFGYAANDIPVTTLTNEITLDVHVPTDGLRALSASDIFILTPTLQVWDARSSTWQELPTVWDSLTGNARASSSQIGTFAVVVPGHPVFYYLPLVGKNVP